MGAVQEGSIVLLSRSKADFGRTGMLSGSFGRLRGLDSFCGAESAVCRGSQRMDGAYRSTVRRLPRNFRSCLRLFKSGCGERSGGYLHSFRRIYGSYVYEALGRTVV